MLWSENLGHSILTELNDYDDKRRRRKYVCIKVIFEVIVDYVSNNVKI